jgi:hypothetical protein
MCATSIDEYCNRVIGKFAGDPNGGWVSVAGYSMKTDLGFGSVSDDMRRW